MLRFFVILKCEVNKRHRMLWYFVILKCQLLGKKPHAVELCDTEVCSEEKTLHAAELCDPEDVVKNKDTAWCATL